MSEIVTNKKRAELPKNVVVFNADKMQESFACLELDEEYLQQEISSNTKEVFKKIKSLEFSFELDANKDLALSLRKINKFFPSLEELKMYNNNQSDQTNLVEIDSESLGFLSSLSRITTSGFEIKGLNKQKTLTAPESEVSYASANPLERESRNKEIRIR